ncbi:MAG: alpha-2-macroglobulin [Acidobacteria bacterium]|nr:alpha-2-macroglobulin [Acidobacteriota bacterium]
MESNLAMIRRLVWMGALAVALPTVAQQEEGRVFFSLSSDRTYAPADTPRIQLWGQGIRKVNFRLYRVEDPVKFFENLRDDHNFGGRMAHQSRHLTRLERLRRWKVSMRDRTRGLMKAQFQGPARDELRSSLAARQAPRKAAAPPEVVTYAELPVLNQQQVVATWEQPFNPKNRWESASVPIPAKGKGLYLVEAMHGPLFAYTIISVTDIGIIAKGSPGKLLARVVHRDTGAPQPGVPVIVYASDKSKRYADSKTDANGFVEAPIGDERPDSALVLARQGSDFAMVSMYGGSLGTHSEDTAAYIYTDRPIYRPGHTVYSRAIIRGRTPKGLIVPKGDVRFEVDDSDGKRVHQASPSMSAAGAVNGKFEIPANAPLGRYYITLRVGENSLGGMFQVEEYRKPEYEVRVTSKERRVLQGAGIAATIDARYFFGEPVAGAKVTYVVHRSRYWPPYYDMDEEEDNASEDSPFAQREQVLEEQGVLDQDGKLNITIPTESTTHDLSYRIEARVTDEAGIEISGAGFTIATVAQYAVSIYPERYVYEPGAKARFKLEARDYDGAPVPNVKFNVELESYSWSDGKRKFGEVLGRGDAVSGVDGKAAVELPVGSGSLRAVVRSTTADRRVVQDDAYVWVTGGAFSWGGADEEEIRIVADKKTYAAGETAKLLIAAAAGTHLWVTAEGAAVHSSKFVTCKDSTVMVELPVERHYMPNFYVQVTAMKEQKVLTGTLMVKVPPAEQKLSIDIKPSKPEFKPGEAGTYSLTAKDAAGKPVQGEFSVGVVDEAIYSVAPDTTKDPLSFFYGREFNRVNTETSLTYHFSGEAGRRRMQLARVRPFTPRAQLKPERLVQPKVRKVFPDTAFWQADVRTDANGRATVKLNFPDALTTWRTTVRGITADHKAGAAINKVIARKYLMVRMGAPRFFRLGDEITVPVIAQNYLTSEKRVRISLEAKGLELQQSASQDLTVPSKATAAVDYRLKVPPGREAVLLAKALSDEESDALELTIPVVPFGVKMSESHGGSMTTNGEAGADLNIPASAEASSRELEISVAPSVAGTMFDALDYLTAFPYGCTEQTMSSFLPNVIVSQAVHSLNLKTSVDTKALGKKVQAGLDRLYGFQHDDGGWGWWKEDDSDPFMTAYVVAGLSQARSAGHDVDKARIDRGVKWLMDSGFLKRGPGQARAYAAYALALAGKSSKELNNDLFAERKSLDAYAAAMLGLALMQSGDPRVAAVAGEVEALVKTSGTEAWWEASKDGMLDIFADVRPEATALAVKLLSNRNPKSPLLPKAALWLVNHRTGGYYWNSTKQTAMVIHGLTDYLKHSGELQPNVALLVTVNGRQVLSRKYTASDSLAPATIRLRGGELQAGANKVRVVRSGEGRLYWSARANYHNPNGPESRTDRKLGITREYFRMAAADRGGKIVYQLEPLSGPVKQGDLLLARLTVSGDPWRYILVEDPLPPGAETVKRDDLYEFASKPPWWTYWFTRREMRDDRVAFFQTYFSRPSGDFMYLMKVSNPGMFRVSPARVEAMYEPEYFATSRSQTLEVLR